jgi:hypothetical protein
MVPSYASTFLSNEFIEKQLRAFSQDPNGYRKRPIHKSKPNVRYFSKDEIQNNQYVTIKRKLRKNLIRPQTKSEIRNNDRAENLVDNRNIIRTLNVMQEKNLLVGEVTQNPWSDDYWGIYKGQLGARYANLDFDFLGEWKEAYDYVTLHDANSIYESQMASQIDLLSPSEKYDLLIGAKNFHLTKRMWETGRRYYERSGQVEAWMGLCHGWAVASYMMPRALKKVTVKAFDGRQNITFYPADIKALATLLWANTRTNTRFIGGRCNDQDPAHDIHDRTLKQDCFDTNPGTWHLSVVNQIGVNKRSFVMDATYDYEVWNQPLINYQYRYFNPLGQEATDNLQEAMIDINQYKDDPFKKFRSREAKFIVGISMQVTYGVESTPMQKDFETPEDDRFSEAYYMYDLELNEKGEIIGGEWYHNNHPDFLWSAPLGTRALTSADHYILSQKNWDGKSPLSKQWKELAVQSATQGQPLAKIVESLIELSREN